VAVTIRPAETDDIESFIAMKNDAWRWAYADILPPEHLAALSVEDQASGWRVAFAAPERDGGVLLAVDDAGPRVVGVASWGASRADDAPPATGEIGMLYVAPDHVGTGLGRRLMDGACDGLCGAGYERATLWVLEANVRGRGFYDHIGWRPDGTRSEHMVECANHPMVRYTIEL
jgi:GNAT superfamily N-acetyltransferase